jgi:hypothetical protein
MSTLNMAVYEGRRNGIGNAISILEASRKTGAPVRAIKGMVKIGLVFMLDDEVSVTSLNLIRREASRFRDRAREPYRGLRPFFAGRVTA